MPYDGPFEIVSRDDKTFVVNVRSKEITGTIDRVNPAFTLVDTYPNERYIDVQI